MKYLWLFSLIFYKCINKSKPEGKITYSSSWENLSSRPIPEWYNEAKFGIFIHWGPYSVPSFSSIRNGELLFLKWKVKKEKGLQKFMKTHYREINDSYTELANKLTGVYFNASEWAETLQNAGAKYVIFTGKGHDGFPMWKSPGNPHWNAVEIGIHRDVVDELSIAITKSGMRFGLYYSLTEWQYSASQKEYNVFLDKIMLPDLFDLVKKYSPELIWVGGEGTTPHNDTKLRQFLSWLYNVSPIRKDVVVNDRWRENKPREFGGVQTFASNVNQVSSSQKKFEFNLSIDSNKWGYRRDLDDQSYMSVKNIIAELIKAVSVGANFNLNIDASKEGVFRDVFKNRLKEIGQWLRINGEGIYKTTPWLFKNDILNRDVWYTSSTPKTEMMSEIDFIDLYAFILQWPKNDVLKIEMPANRISLNSTVSVLGSKETIQWVIYNRTLLIPLRKIPDLLPELPYCLKITNVEQSFA